MSEDYYEEATVFEDQGAGPDPEEKISPEEAEKIREESLKDV